MTKLEGITRNGDVIHETLEMAKSVGFKCVARYWYDQTQSLSDGIDQLENDARKREDIMCPMKHMGLGINSVGDYVLEHIDGREFRPTDHAFRQLATWSYVPHTLLKAYTSPIMNQNGTVKFERDEKDKDTLVRVFQNGMRRIEQDKEFRFRTYTDGTLRAVLSDRYAIINNVWYLETLANLFKEMGGDEPRLSHWKGDADTLYGNMLIPDTCREENDSDYGGMISLSNCEIGIRRLSQFPSIFRAICMNGCIWDQNSGSKINQVHRGELDLNDLRERIALNIHDQIPLISAGIDRFLAMKNMTIDKSVNLGNIFALIASENAMSPGQNGQASELVKQYLAHESDNRNAFGVVNAITRTAQLYTPTEWVRFDEIAGKIMNYSTNQWDNFVSRAKVMDQKVYDRMFGVVAV